MDRNYDEVIADKLIQKAESRLEAQEKRMETFDQKLEQSIIDQKEFSGVQSKMNRYFLNVLSKKTNGKG